MQITRIIFIKSIARIYYTCYNKCIGGGIHLKPKEILKILNSNGWDIKDQHGSHIQLVHKLHKGKITVPNHNKDLKLGTLNSILKQAGLK